MRSSFKIYNSKGVFFITSTIIGWIPVFTSDKYFDILINAVWFSQTKKDLKLYAYVFLDNHFHMIVSGDKLTNIMKSIKGYTAKAIIDQLQFDGNFAILNKLKELKLEHKVKSEYQVWQESFHPQEILTNEIFQQKAEYIHFNPVRKGIVTKPEDWKYSSAGYFSTGEEGVLKLNGLI